MRATVVSAIAVGCLVFGVAVATGQQGRAAALPLSLTGSLGGSSLRAQARELYKPAAVYYRSLTSAQKNALSHISKLIGNRIDACQRPYAKHLFRGIIVGTSRYKLYRIYEDGALMQEYQARVAAVEPELGLAARAWDHMSLTDSRMRAFAHAIGAELTTDLTTPRFHTCGFLHQLSRHHFSLSWAMGSANGKRAEIFMKDLTNDSDHTVRFWEYIQAKRILHLGLLSRAQLRNLANLPGELD